MSKSLNGSYGWGGARRGAGRKPGVPNKNTRATVAKAQADGLELPLARLLRRMNDSTLSETYKDQLAGLAAPFCHPRLSAITLPKRPSQMSDQELQHAIAAAEEDARKQGITWPPMMH
jgi:hypothetical protein